MKKILFFMAALALAINANAQDDRFGVKAGLNVASLNGDDVPDTFESKAGFHIGGFAEFVFSDQFSIQPELVFSTQGGKAEIASEEIRSNYTYLNIPILAKYYIIEGLSVNLGPQLGILLSAKTKTEILGTEVEVDVKDDTKTTDLALAIGGEYILPMGLGFNARYNIGLSKIDDSGADADVKNGVFQLGVSYSFN